MSLYAIPPLLTMCCFAGLAVLTLRKPPGNRARRLFAGIAVLGALLYADVFLASVLRSKTAALWISRADHAGIVYLVPLYIHFFHEYLKVSGRRWLVRGSYLFAFLMMWLTPTPLYIRSMGVHEFGYFASGGPLYPLFGAAATLTAAYVLALTGGAVLRERRRERRTGLVFVLLGFGTLGLLNGLSVLTNLGVSIYPPGNFSFVPLTVFYLGLFKYDLLDMGLLVRRGLIYALLTVLLTGLYALLAALAGLVTGGGPDFGARPAVTVGFLLLMAVVFGPLQSGTRKFVDRLFFRERHGYRQALKRMARGIAGVRDLDEIAGRLTETLADTLAVTDCALYLEVPGEGAYARYAPARPSPSRALPERVDGRQALARRLKTHGRPILIGRMAQAGEREVCSDMAALRAALVLPLPAAGPPAGFVALGAKRSGGVFSGEDLDLLETLAGQAALAVENARFYGRLQGLNAELEATVARRTRSLEEALEKKEKTQEQLVRSESLAAIGQLVAGTAHELNNPLASATSLVQSVVEDLSAPGEEVPPPDELLDDLRFVDRELGRARAIVSSLLGLSRQTSDYTENVDLNVVVEDALRVLHNVYKHAGLVVDKALAPDLPAVRGNFANLGQVVLNVLQNAIDAVDGTGGTISLATRHDARCGQVAFVCRDSGPGVPEAIRRDIFKPFFTTKAVGRGTGLGLYICHEIVQRHGGTLALEKCRGGAIFVIRLPAAG